MPTDPAKQAATAIAALVSNDPKAEPLEAVEAIIDAAYATTMREREEALALLVEVWETMRFTHGPWDRWLGMKDLLVATGQLGADGEVKEERSDD